MNDRHVVVIFSLVASVAFGFLITMMSSDMERVREGKRHEELREFQSIAVHYGYAKYAVGEDGGVQWEWIVPDSSIK